MNALQLIWVADDLGVARDVAVKLAKFIDVLGRHHIDIDAFGCPEAIRDEGDMGGFDKLLSFLQLQ
jgi:hypothetical protein